MSENSLIERVSENKRLINDHDTRLRDVELGQARQTAILEALTPTIEGTRAEIATYRDELKKEIRSNQQESKKSIEGFAASSRDSVNGLTVSILAEMSARRDDGAKATMKILGLFGAGMTLLSGVLTWYITEHADAVSVDPTHIEAQP